MYGTRPAKIIRMKRAARNLKPIGSLTNRNNTLSAVSAHDRDEGQANVSPRLDLFPFPCMVGGLVATRVFLLRRNIWKSVEKMNQSVVICSAGRAAEIYPRLFPAGTSLFDLSAAAHHDLYSTAPTFKDTWKQFIDY